MSLHSTYDEKERHRPFPRLTQVPDQRVFSRSAASPEGPRFRRRERLMSRSKYPVNNFFSRLLRMNRRRLKFPAPQRPVQLLETRRLINRCCCLGWRSAGAPVSREWSSSRGSSAAQPLNCAARQFFDVSKQEMPFCHRKAHHQAAEMTAVSCLYSPSSPGLPPLPPRFGPSPGRRSRRARAAGRPPPQANAGNDGRSSCPWRRRHFR